MELITDLTPEEHRKLILNIRKQKERSKKKDSGDQPGEDDEDDSLQQELREHREAHAQRKAGGKNQPRQKFDEMMNESGSEDEGGDDEDDFLPAQLKEQLANKLAAKRSKQGTWIREGQEDAMDDDNDEPLDFLDRNAISRVVCECIL